MKIALIVVLGLAGLAGLITLVGLLLPREHRVSSQIVLRRPAGEVWAAIRNIAETPTWWPQVKAVTRLPDKEGHEVWEQKLSGFALVLEISQEAPPSRLRTDIVTRPDAPFGGTWIQELVPEGDGTRITVTEDGWVGNPIFRVVSRITGYHGTLDDYLKALGRRFGETVTPQHVT
jgi:hypothetical protein